MTCLVDYVTTHLWQTKTLKMAKILPHLVQVQFIDIASLYFISTIIIKKMVMNLMDLYDKLAEILCVF